MIRAEREKAIERKTNDAIKIAPYTDEEIDSISEQIGGRSRRRASNSSVLGGRQRRRRDRTSRQRSVARYRHGGLAPEHGYGSLRWSLRSAWPMTSANVCPEVFKRDDLNIPDVQQRVHWDHEWARRAGTPASLRLWPHAKPGSSIYVPIG